METRAFRVAVRHEGPDINIYAAHVKSMKDAVIIATVKRAVVDSPEGLEAVKTFAKALAECITRDIGLSYSRMDVEPAPEHEKSGHD